MERPEDKYSNERAFSIYDDLKILLIVTSLFLINYIFAIYIEIKSYQ